MGKAEVFLLLKESGSEGMNERQFRNIVEATVPQRTPTQ